MAENTADKGAKPQKAAKEPLGSRLNKFFREYRSEARKIVWPTREQTIKNNNIVIAVMLAAAVMVGVLDFLFMNGIQLLSKLGTLYAG